MTKRRLPVSTKHPLGTFGLLLILLVAKLAEYSDPSHQSYRRRAQAFLARRAIDGVTAIGWIVDRLCDRMSGPVSAPCDITQSS
jgi:hypothetical protein